MARYFIHLRDGSEDPPDPEGREYDNLDALRKAVMAAERDLMAGDVRAGVIDSRFRIDAKDEVGRIVYSLPFKHALNIIPEDEKSPGRMEA